MTQIPTWSGGQVSPTNGRAAPGTTIGGRYALRAAVGHGGMGTVWRAADTLLRRDVAVKEVILPPGMAPSDRDAMYERTLREARAAAALQHPAVVQVYDVVHEAGRPWIVMELLDARSLADMIIEDGPVAPRAVAKIGIALLGALEVAHAIGVLHRDVKPANVLICTDGRCVLTDFGVARMPTDVQLTTPGMVLGSPHFISPERAMGQDFGPPSDLFSLGVTLYTAVEGRPPFDKGDPIETMHAVVEDPPAPPTRAGALTQVLFGLLEKDPSRRYDVMLSRNMLRELLAGPLASKAPAHMMTDPYAVVPTQRAGWQPPTPAPPPQPSGQIGGRAMLQPGESLTDRLRELQQGGAAAPQSPAPAAAPRYDDPTGASPTAPIPPHAVVQSSARYDAPTGAQPAWEQPGWGPPRARPAGGRGAALVETARRTGSQLVTTVKGWPRNVQIAAAAGVAAVVLIGGIVLLSGGGDPETPAPAANATSAPAAPAFETQRHASRGVAVEVPKGWTKSGGKGDQVFVDYIDPDDKGRRVRILVENSKSEPIRFLQAAGNRLRDNVSKNCTRPYAELGLTEVEVAGKPAAELEYTCGEGGSKRHGVWRAIVEGGKAYSFYLTTPEDKFADSKQIFDEMVRTFQLTA
ncbi:protein kinase [Phytohabitans sp. ZYX-F-186]|uniref:non-specific serine/threonine protein kinase n=1 Tax=Phytohabitans maris TaxID=3071409 RepID=A0ABU0ZSN9_9ACTN|nr:protein kinase [Phytohabitans sp. ZYX-F-186]MDQ7910050.1 protein kinase [Phytohabitans sp. ZYX-F-186]